MRRRMFMGMGARRMTPTPGTLSGTAFFMGAAVAKTVPNNTLYTYP
ncbi:hypothetical protein ACFQ9V_17030 [Leifsonia sp. NPDC056665]